MCSSFYLDNSNIKLSGNIKKRGEIVLEGSNETRVANEIDKKAGFTPRYIQIQNIFFHAQSSGRSIPADSVTTLSQELRLLEQERKEKLEKLVMKNSGAYTSLYAILHNISLFSPDELAAIQARFTGSITQSSSFQQLKNIVENSTSVNMGKPLKEFTLPDTTGIKHSLSVYKGKYTFVDFWASWCAPCRKQVPALREIYKTFKPQGCEMVGVSIDEDGEK